MLPVFVDGVVTGRVRTLHVRRTVKPSLDVLEGLAGPKTTGFSGVGKPIRLADTSGAATAICAANGGDGCAG